MQDWNLNKASRECSKCKLQFSQNQQIFCGIVEVNLSVVNVNANKKSSQQKRQQDDQEIGFVRSDYCQNCFNEIQNTLFSFWNTKVPESKQAKFDDIEKVVEFYKRLVGRQNIDDSVEKIKYFLTLILLRKKKLKVTATKRNEGRTIMVIESTWDGESSEIMDPEISETDIIQIKNQMEKLFDIEFNGEVKPTPA